MNWYFDSTQFSAVAGRAILNGPVSSGAWAANSGYNVVTQASQTLRFEHNNLNSEAWDIMTLGNRGGDVWTQGMYWGNIDNPTNYGGFMNTTTPVTSGGANGDRLLIYMR